MSEDHNCDICPSALLNYNWKIKIVYIEDE